jgi:hypothetical protein
VKKSTWGEERSGAKVGKVQVWFGLVWFGLVWFVFVCVFFVRSWAINDFSSVFKTLFRQTKNQHSRLLSSRATLKSKRFVCLFVCLFYFFFMFFLIFIFLEQLGC